jgi:hypothetical protein
MSKFNKYTNVFGWIAFVVSLVVYVMTVEPSVSLWDCGEFIAASYKLQVVHPPGAPFFLMTGRIFSMFAGSEAGVGFAVNMLSVVASAFTVLFTFWITVHFARKMLSPKETPSQQNSILIWGAAFVASLTLTFADTFWFSAVEAEVYAMSSFFTALTFWVMIKWEQKADRPGADKFIVFAFYLVGLAVGTHLLNLLVIPAMAFIYYFKKFKDTTRKGIIYTFLIGLGILFFIKNLVIPGIVWLVAYGDKFFRNSLDLPYWTGAFFMMALIFGLIAYGVFYSIKTKKYYLNLAFMSLAFVVIGYSSYTMVVVRSMANPAIDMNDPEDPFNLLSYINREQYGDRPLAYGPYFNAKPIDSKVVKTIYKKGEDNYEEIGPKYDYVYDSKDKTFFPRMGDRYKEQGDQGYRYWSGMGKIQKEISALEQTVKQDPQNTQAKERLDALVNKKPSFANNVQFFVNYQLGYMWFRYFMWNFSGRQNDQQGHSYNRYVDGNWISGIPLVDTWRIGKQSTLPDHMKNNQANNKYYMLPLILGILGMVFHYKRERGDFVITTVLFVFTGILIIVFLNQPPFEPRERDYTNVGSIQTFCIWVGLGVLYVANLFKRFMSAKGAGVAAVLVSLMAVPVLMGSQNWDDHDRSDRYLGIDFAINYLESCAENAILFTNGDNDTYPLWYAQNVEGIRTDVRIINMALLPTDWYAGALLRKVYKSDALPLTLTMDDLRAGKNDVVYHSQNMGIDQNVYFPLDRVIDVVTTNDKNKQAISQTGEHVNFLPTRKFKIAINKQKVIENNVVMEKDQGKIVAEMTIDYPKNHMSKGDIVLFDLIAENAKRGWPRPIYFTSTTGSSTYMNLQSYFQQEGLVHRLVPIKSALQGSYPQKIADDILYERIMNKFKWSGMKEKKNFFLDDKATLVPQNMRHLIYRLAMQYYYEGEAKKTENDNLKNSIDAGVLSADQKAQYEDLIAANEKLIAANNEKSLSLMKLSLEEIPRRVIAYRPETVTGYVDALSKLGMKDESQEFVDHFMTRTEQMVDWLGSLSKSKRTAYNSSLVENHLRTFASLIQIVENQKMNDPEGAKARFEKLRTKYENIRITY